MKHAAITIYEEEYRDRNHLTVELAGGRKAILCECEYTPEELEAFRAKQAEWILRRAGTQQFLADSDSGEDATGDYCGYFVPDSEKAVFHEGKPVGFYLCEGWLSYSGNGRALFGIDDWGYPGYDAFSRMPSPERTHVFLFSEPESHEWKDWTLLRREPGREYRSSLKF